MGKRYTPRVFAEPTISRSRLAAYIEAAQYDAVLDPEMSVDEKVCALRALAALARSLSDEWRQAQKFYNRSGERFWLKSCGLAPDGGPTTDMLSRIAEVAAEVRGE